MQTYRFAPSTGQTALILAGAAVFFLLFAAMAISLSDNALFSGVMIVLAAFAGLVAAIMAYRLIARPTMIGVGPDGIFMKRLGVTLPWESIGAIRRVAHEAEDLIELEAAGHHPAFEERSVLLGMALNERAGLPPLAIAMSQYAGTVEAFLAAVRACGKGDLIARDADT